MNLTSRDGRQVVGARSPKERKGRKSRVEVTVEESGREWCSLLYDSYRVSLGTVVRSPGWGLTTSIVDESRVWTLEEIS